MGQISRAETAGPASQVWSMHTVRAPCATVAPVTSRISRSPPHLRPNLAVFPPRPPRVYVGWECKIDAPCDVQHCDGAKSARLIQKRVRADDCRARDTSHAATSVAVRPQVPACHRAGTESRKLVFSEPYRVTQPHEPLHARASSPTHRVDSR